MTATDVRALPLGLYRVHWRSGGSSLASVGMLENGDRWVAPCNWVSPLVEDAAPVWRTVLRVEVVLLNRDREAPGR